MSSRTKAIILKNRSLEFLLLYRQNYAYIGESDVHFYADSCMSCLEYVHYAAVDVLNMHVSWTMSHEIQSEAHLRLVMLTLFFFQKLPMEYHSQKEQTV